MDPPLTSIKEETVQEILNVVKVLEVGEGHYFRTLITRAEGRVIERVKSTRVPAHGVIMFIKVSLLYPDGRLETKFIHPDVEVGVTK